MSALQSLVMMPSAGEQALTRDVTAAAHGDRDAYARLVDGTRNLVASIALAIVRDVTLSEDVAQDVYLYAWRDLNRLRNPASFLPWLRQLTRNRAHDEARRRARRRQEPLDDTAHRDPRPDARAQLIAGEEQAALQAALDELPELAREVVTLFYREGRSIAQVADLLGLSEDAVKQRLSRARSVLRQATMQRLGDVIGKSAPTATFTALVLAALTAGAPATATAAAIGSASKLGGVAAKLALPSLAMKLAGVLLGVFGGLVAGSLGVVGGMRKEMCRARDDEEREALRRFTRWAIAFVVFGTIAMPVGNRLWPGWGVLVGFALMWLPMMIGYMIVLPRITARRRALERLEDPTAEQRQRREQWLSIAGCAFGSIMGLGTVAWVIWEKLP